MQMRLCILLCHGLACTYAAGQEHTLIGPIAPDVATMQAWVNGNVCSMPVITLGGDDVMQFGFDILSAERDYLRYSLVHCDADWQPSRLSPSEYAGGFNEWPIDDTAPSRSTTVPYTHYSIEISDAEHKPKVSGNYLLRVYREDDMDNAIAQYRFLVTEQTARIEATVTTNTDIDFNKAHQQVSAKVDVMSSGVRDPLNDLVLKIEQNNRRDNEATMLRPTKMLNATTAVYEHQPQLIFEAGNEYRRFETVSVYNPAMNVAEVSYHEPYYHYALETDTPRTDDTYAYDQTLRGGYVVRSDISDYSDIEADYAIVHFTLCAEHNSDREIYIDSDFLSRRLDDTSRMAYNKDTGMYQRSLLMKQGAYSYQYLCKNAAVQPATTSCIEGNFFLTNNSYRIVAYARNPLDRYDRIIAVAEINTQNASK